MTIEISLADECKNGHQDFHITADLYQHGKPKTDRYWISGGCQHEEILAVRPDLKIFVNLHGCDYLGAPMATASNMLYHLRNGFNNTKPDAPTFQAEYIDCYRIGPDQFTALKQCKNEIQFSLALQSLGILNQWETEAMKATEILEGMTGSEFLNDSKRSQYVPPSQEKIAEEAKKEAEGYYTPEAEKKRSEEAEKGIIYKLALEKNKAIAKAENEYNVKLAVLRIGGKAALDNCIFYNHTQQLAFNWKGYDQLSEKEVARIMAEIKLPQGVTIEDKKGK